MRCMLVKLTTLADGSALGREEAAQFPLLTRDCRLSKERA